MAGRKKEVAKPGRLSLDDIKKQLNKKAGLDVAFNLATDDDPTTVKEWIPTGSDWLDCILVRGHRGGIPAGKIMEIAGQSAAGKSYMAAVIAASAIKKGFTVVYFDAENAVDKSFWTKLGVDINDILYVQARSIEFVLSSIDDLLKTENKFVFILDSLAATPTDYDISAEAEGDFNPRQRGMEKAAVLAKGFPKITQALGNSGSSFIVLNQLRANTNFNNPYDVKVNPFKAPGGSALEYFASLRIWLTKRKGKDSFILDENGFKIGAEVKALVKKSRFGSEGRECVFSVVWADDEKIGIQNEESILEAIKGTAAVTSSGGPWYTLTQPQTGEVFKFQAKTFKEMMKNDGNFASAVNAVLEEYIIVKFAKKELPASAFYDIEGVDGGEDKD